MTDTKTTCPVCGSDQYVSSAEPVTMKLPFSDTIQYELIKDVCSVCQIDGDFNDVNNTRYADAEKLAEKDEVENILGYLQSKKITNAYLERSLGLPQRTVARWKSGKCSQSSLVLLRMIRRFPWLLKVADAGYEVATSNYLLMENAAQLISANTGLKLVNADTANVLPSGIDLIGSGIRNLHITIVEIKRVALTNRVGSMVAESDGNGLLFANAVVGGN